MIRQGINYGWKYCERWDDKYIAPDAVEDDFIEVDIPHANKEIPYNNFDEEMYQFISCYRKRIKIDSSHKGKRIILEFGAVANMAVVYFNGEHVGEHKGGYTAFTIDVTDNVLWGKDNLIVVKVDSTERPDIPPFGGVVDYLCYGGIYREVYLQIRPSDYIKRMLLTPEVPARGAPKLTADITLSGSCEGVLNIEVCDAEGVVVASAKREGEFIASEGKLPKVTAVFKIPAAKLWDIDNPYLYTVIATFGEDEVRDRCGLRHCAFAKDGFYLNYKPIKIVGLNRHQSYPYVGYAMPAHVQKDEAEFLKKELGVNLVRTSHYPNSRHFLDRCDELGLLVFTEIPGWQYVSKDETWREVCLQHVREMIREDYNHPSIILWGVRINESGDDDALYTATNALAHKLDKTRPTGGVRCIPHSHLLEDVYTYNDFIHSGGKTV
ncbi:MAG: glycoside hydrolase family 2 protein, partial [Clostridia bacterium]|nr:glycoside hydrolase family 2 protein [Clostridia bacterium]